LVVRLLVHSLESIDLSSCRPIGSCTPPRWPDAVNSRGRSEERKKNWQWRQERKRKEEKNRRERLRSQRSSPSSSFLTSSDEPATVRKVKRVKYEDLKNKTQDQRRDEPTRGRRGNTNRSNSVIILRREPHRVSLEVVADSRAERALNEGIRSVSAKSGKENREGRTCCRPFGVGGRRKERSA